MKLLSPGDGKNYPQYRDRVSIYYTGRIVGAHEFDREHRDRGDPLKNKPFTFNIGVGQELKGWEETIPKMDLGSRWKIVVPPEYAYGERGIPGYVGANKELEFEIEILQINKNKSEKYAKELDAKLEKLKKIKEIKDMKQKGEERVEL
jgi:FK506-binding protein 1